VRRLFLGCLFALITLVSTSNADAGFSGLYVFGDSLSDSGNNAAILSPNVTPVPISGDSFTPIFPYASGRYTNAEVWPEMLASSLRLTADPWLRGGTDYAFGGARSGPLIAIPPSLETQVALFLIQYAGAAPRNALYMVAGGGNDALDALDGIAGCGGILFCISGVIQAAVSGFTANIGNIIAALQAAGAQDMVIWDVPDIGAAPSVRAEGDSALATAIASSMNAALLNTISGNPHVTLFDAFGLLDDVITDPTAFGLSNVTDACAQYIDCDPSQYLFWDGIHPTSAADAIISDTILALIEGVPEPSTLPLLSIAAGAFLFARCLLSHPSGESRSSRRQWVRRMCRHRATTKGRLSVAQGEPWSSMRSHSPAPPAIAAQSAGLDDGPIAMLRRAHFLRTEVTPSPSAKREECQMPHALESLKPIYWVIWFTLFLIAVATSNRASAQALSACSWPFEVTGQGFTNIATPDTNATYWVMPLDTSHWPTMIIDGKYPEARFFNFVSYSAIGAVIDSIIDADIAPDRGQHQPVRRQDGSRTA
jgi:outer membrane lipase/esterase